MALPDWMSESPALRFEQHRPARAGVPGAWPEWLPDEVREALARRGIATPWRHQEAAARALHAGIHTGIATGTASGKSLAYLLPVLAETYAGVGTPRSPGSGATPLRRSDRLRGLLSRPNTALYLAPTKALAHDQLRACRELGLPGWRVGTLDGDSDRAERDWARDHAAYVLTNPDMLHHVVLPQHERWHGLLRSLRYVVIDEAHHYSGIFGAHVAQILRRLRRICAELGADPVFVTASATSADPARTLAALTGVEQSEVLVVDQDSAPRPELDLAIWQPDAFHDSEAAALLARLVGEDTQTLAFVNSRWAAEHVAQTARESTGRPVLAYRGGYLPTERRAIEADLNARRCIGVAATNALELGVDIAGMDAVVVSGYPGTQAGLWQRLGRAGRGGRSALGVLIARSDPLDAWLCDHPEQLLAGPLEQTAVNPANPYVLAAHIGAAAQELPLREGDERWFGPLLELYAEQLVAAGVLRRRPNGWYWTSPERAAAGIDVRGIGGRQVEICESATGRIVGTVDPDAADRTVHAGAVYVHQGTSWLVDEYLPEDATALVHQEAPGWTTQARASSRVELRHVLREQPLGAGQLQLAQVMLTSQVVDYLRRDARTGTVWDSSPLDLPERSMLTEAVWFRLPAEELARLGWGRMRLAAAAHALEHTALGLLGALVPGDRRDLGGLSLLDEPGPGACSVVIHERVPGGAGFVAEACSRAERWLATVHDRLLHCDCATGCPRCVISPQCEQGNQALDREGAQILTGLLLGVRV